MKNNKPNKDQYSWCIPGRKCWVLTNLPEIFIPAKILSFDEALNKVEVNFTIAPSDPSITTTYDLQNISEFNEEEAPDKISGYEDMVTMDCLNEAELLNNMSIRYKQNKIFTYIGPTLLVMNPYKALSSEFVQEKIIDYHSQTKADVFSQKDKPPHVYAIAGKSYHQLFSHTRNQAIVISGESGAGKTENTKYAMNFLTSLSQEDNSSGPSKEIPIEDRILGCNPILEAFGNAKTVRNDNSSRFGKYVRILVDLHSKKIKGAAITNYLLEKSRVTTQSTGERNYHVFYQLFKMKPENKISSQFLESLCLNGKTIDDFVYLKSSKGVGIGLSDEEFLKDVLNSFDKMNFRDDEREGIFKLLSGILYIGNIEFNDKKFSDNNPCEIDNISCLQMACDILGFNDKMLMRALVFKTREIGKQIIESPVNKVECGFLRDSLSKSLYEKLFNWLVKRLNTSILPAKDLQVNRSVRKSIKEMRKSVLLQEEGFRLSIGLLDIFGFENFAINSFEQLCINFTNEKLQQLYIAYVFKSEEAEFIEQGLKDQLYMLSYEDNQPIIDLIDKYPLGIFDLLEESCSLGSGTDDALLQKLAKTHKDNPKLNMPKIAKDKFVLIHTAKAVEYIISGFRVKNKDHVTKELENTILSSKFESIAAIYENKIDKIEEKTQPGKKGEKTLAAKFRTQMKDLMQELMSCDVNFIRCIKPNEEKKPDYFFTGFVLQQIKYLGVLESIRIRKEGFPYRKEYKNFIETYKCLLKGCHAIKKQEDVQKKVTILLNHLISEEGVKGKCLYGNTKLYLKQEISTNLDKKLMELYKEKKARAKQILAQYRRFCYKRTLLKKLENLHKKVILKFVRVQALMRRKITRKIFLSKKQSIVKIKKIFVKMLKKRTLSRLHEKILLFRKWTKKKQSAVKLFNNFKKLYRRFFFKKWLEKVRIIREIMIQKAKKEKEMKELAEREEQKKKEAELLAAEKAKKEAEKARKEAEMALFQAALSKAIIKSPPTSPQKRAIKKISGDEINKTIPNSNNEDIKKESPKKENEISFFSNNNKASSPEKNEIFSFKDKIEEEPKIEKKIEPKIEKKIETKIEPKIEQKIETKIETKFEPKIEPKFEEEFKSIVHENENIPKPKIVEIQTKTYGNINMSQLKEFDPSFFIKLKAGIILPRTNDLSLDLFLSDHMKKTQLFSLYSEDVVLDLESLNPELLKDITKHTFWEFVEPLVQHQKSWGKVVSVAVVMSFSKSAQYIPLLAHSEKKDKQLSNNQFSQIKKFLKVKDSEEELMIAMKILMEGFNGNIAVKDETYLQIIKQLNNNPDRFLRLKLYKLLGLIASTFPVSIWTFGVVMSFLLEVVGCVNKIETDEEVILHAKFAFNKVRKTYESGGKKLPPLEHEAKCIWTLRKIPIKLFFLNGKGLTIFVESWSKVCTVYKLVEDLIGMRGLWMFLCLVVRCPEKDDIILGEDITLIEELTRIEFNKMKGTIKTYRLIVKLKIYHPSISIEAGKDMRSLIFFQIFDEYLKGTFPCQIDEIVYLSSLYLYIEKEGSSYEKIFNLESSSDNLVIGIDIEKYIPKGCISKNITKSYILSKVLSRYINNKENKPIEACKQEFLNFLRKYDEFMSHKFSARYCKICIKKGELEESPLEEVNIFMKPFLILINGKTSKNKIVLHYKEIEAFGSLALPSKIFVLTTFDLQTHIFECEMADEIDLLMRSYLNLLNCEQLN